MFLEIIIAITLGVLAGTVTGVIPGIHINLVSALIVGAAPTILPLAGLPAVACFIVAMSVTHTYLDVIPSVYLGAPDPDMVLSVLPGHRLLLDGLGLHAVQLTQIGSIGATILSVLLFPAFILVVRLSGSFLDNYLHILLLGMVIFLLLQAGNKLHKKLYALLLFILSGLLGLFVFHLPGLQNPLFPLLSGLFGVATLLMSLQAAEGMPEQRKEPLHIPAQTIGSAVITGQAAGFLTAVFPGLGSASAAALSSAFVQLKERGFLVLVGSIGTVNFILSLVTYLVLNKARNGSIVAVKALAGDASLPLVLLCLAAIMLGAGLASLILTKLTPVLARMLAKINYVALIKLVLFVLVLLAAILSGWYGLLILATATTLGLLAPLLNVPRIYLMGCLLGPVLLYLW